MPENISNNSAST